MSARDYAKAISAALKPAGFVRVKSRQEWRRELDGFFEEISLQGTRTFPKVTVNFALRHERARTAVYSVAGPGTMGTDFTISDRLGLFLGPYDRWWGRDDPEGPAEVAELIRAKLLPYLDRMHSMDRYIEALTKQFLGERWPYVTPILELAVLLHERGEVGRVREILDNPPDRISPEELARVAAVRRLLFGSDHAAPKPA